MSFIYSYDKKYLVQFDDGTSSVINPALVKQQNISDEQLEEIVRLWKIRHNIEVTMSKFSPESNKKLLKELFADWQENEFELQEAWGFEPNRNYHRDFNLPHCTCPKLDNEERVGTSSRVFTGGCVYHG